MRPSDALEVQAELLRHARSPTYLAEMLSTHAHKQQEVGKYGPGNDNIDRLTPRQQVEIEVSGLSEAETYLVESDMCAVAVHAAKSMGSQPIVDSDLPSHCGFVITKGAHNLFAFRWQALVIGGVSGVYFATYADFRGHARAPGIPKMDEWFTPFGTPSFVRDGDDEALINRAADSAIVASPYGQRIAMVTSPVFQSEIGNELCTRHGCPAIVWYSRAQDGAAVAQVSLRSTDAMADVSEIAAVWGGGGHRNAAGAVVPLGVWLAFIGRMVAMEGVS